MKIPVILLACSLVAAQATRPVTEPDKKPAKPATATAAKTIPKEAPVTGQSKPAAEPPPAAESPKKAAKTETLRFNVNWPSGLSLGEGQLTSELAGNQRTFSFNVEAAIPGFAVAESGSSKSTVDFCSLELVKKAKRGKRATEEQTVFDSRESTATRTTVVPKGGGKTEIRINPCAKDALTFLNYLRSELAAGRLPSSQPVYYGAGYQTRVQYKGTQQVRSGSESVEADILTATIKGPAAELTVDLFFARDPARTPLLAQIPVAVGKFTVEFVP
jgi:hypothetical protein